MFFCTSFFFFKPKTSYEMRISDWSSDVCSSDLTNRRKSAIFRPHHSRTVPSDIRQSGAMRCHGWDNMAPGKNRWHHDPGTALAGPLPDPLRRFDRGAERAANPEHPTDQQSHTMNRQIGRAHV